MEANIIRIFSHSISFLTYLVDNTADGGTSLHGLNWGGHVSTLSHSLVSNAVVKVESTHWQSLKVVELHLAINCFFLSKFMIKSFF